jgi:hypothetical protein
MKEKRNYRVYILLFPNGKSYVGMTSLPMEERWGNGFKYRKKEDMFNDIVKYGWDNIKHIVYDNYGELYTKEEAEKEEKYFIWLWQTTEAKYGYNKESGGLSNFKSHPDTIAKLKMAHSKPVLQYTRDGEFLNEYISVDDASRITKIYKTAIAATARGERKTAGNFVWKYKNN